VLLSYNLTATVHSSTRIQNQSNTAIDNIFIDNCKLAKYTVSPIYSGLSDHDAELLTIKDMHLHLQHRQHTSHEEGHHTTQKD
jgi:hypothetical protein